MSSGCGDVLSLADLQTAKKHQIFEAEVITGKSGGVAGGADIDYATNPVTGQTQKTLPAVLRDAGFSPVPWDFSTGGTLTTADRDKVVYDPVSKTWYSYTGTLPVTVPAGFNPVGNAYWKPRTDPTLREELASSTGTTIIGRNGGTLEDSLAAIDLDVSALMSASTVNSNEGVILGEEPGSKIDNFGVLVTGQSLAEGGVGYDASLWNTSALNNAALTLSGGPIGIGSASLGSKLQGLNERIRATISSTLADKILTSGVAGYVYAHGQALGGANYAALKKGGSSGVYEKCVSQVNSIKSRVQNVVYKCVAIVHGEQDGVDNNTNYAANLSEWIEDFNLDIKSSTSQSEDVHGYLCQTATAGGYGFNGGITQVTFPSPIEQLKAHRSNPRLTLIGSKYMLPYYDHAHLTNRGQAILGEYYGQAITYERRTGLKFEPCRPVSFFKSANTVIIKFIGYGEGLTIDTSAVKPIANHGFSYSDSNGNTITSVSVTGIDEVTLTLSGSVASNPVVAYAYHNGAGGATNQANGLGDRGNLRGTGVNLSKVTGEPLHPWCVIFREEI